MSYIVIKPHNCSIFAESLVKNQSIDFGENNENFRIFACLHPPIPSERTTTHLKIYCNKIHGILLDVEGSLGGLGMGISFAVFPTVVECQHKQQRRGMPTCRCLSPHN